jgi:hypothetical protein
MDLTRIILYKLYRKRIIGEKHTPVENVFFGIPKHLHGQAKYNLKELIKQGLIMTKPAFYGLQISLNPLKIKEIRKIIEN